MNRPTFETLCRALLYQALGAAPPPQAGAAAAAFLSRQKRRLPPLFGATLAVFDTIFLTASYLVNRRSFAALPEPRQQQQVRRWQNSRCGPCRDYIRLYQSLLLLAHFSGRENTPPSEAP